MSPKPASPEVVIEYVSPDLLDFDPNNPRFAEKMANRSQESIQKLIFGEPYFAAELVDSFLENGFIDFEPLVVKRQKQGKRLTVIEGNRRLAAIREIRNNPYKYPHNENVDDLALIPVLVFPGDAPSDEEEDDLRIYLGVRHLMGFREWPMLSKAQFLDKESKRAGGLTRVLDETRLSKTAAKRFLVPLRILEKANEKIPLGEDFSNLSEALGRAGTVSFLELEVDQKTLEIKSFDKKKFSQLLDDLYGTKNSIGKRDSNTKVVTDTRDISTYSRVLNSKAASTKLHQGKSLAEAEIYVDTTEESLKRLLSLTKQIGALLKKITPGKKTNQDNRIINLHKTFDSEIKKYVTYKKS